MNRTAIVRRLLTWFEGHARDLPWRKTRNPYAIWISEIMLQQTQVKTVIPFWERWLRELPTVESLAGASSEKIHRLWEGLGYYTRVRNLQKAAMVITRDFDGIFPKKFDEILSLPGVGRYTAGAIASIAFNQAAPILDGNVMRVLARVFGIDKNPREKKTNQQLWQIAAELVAMARRRESTGDNACSHFNQALMELGATVCLPRRPRCEICPVRRHCVAFQTGRSETLPAPGRRAAVTRRRFVAWIVHHRGHFLVQQRPGDVVNGHLWEFPNAEVAPGDHLRQKLESLFHVGKAVRIDSLCRIHHSITRYRITLDACRVTGPVRSRNGAVWKSAAELEQLALPSAHRKILRHWHDRKS